MPFLSEADQNELKDIFSKQMQQSVRLRVLTKPTSKLYIPGQQLCATCSEAEPFARELAALSDKLEVLVHDLQAEPALAEQFGTNGTLPVIQVEPVSDAGAEDTTPKTSGAMRFVGLPAGYEFSTLIADILDVSSGTVALSQATQDELRALDEDVHLQVFVTPT